MIHIDQWCQPQHPSSQGSGVEVFPGIGLQILLDKLDAFVCIVL